MFSRREGRDHSIIGNGMSQFLFKIEQKIKKDHIYKWLFKFLIKKFKFPCVTTFSVTLLPSAWPPNLELL